MPPDIAANIQKAFQASLAGEINYPQFIERLQSTEVERYHADFSRREITYYRTNGESLVLPSPHGDGPVADDFSANGLEAAIRQSQRGEQTYLEFIQKAMAAGCVGYFVQITGRQILYFGRRGEIHPERFPPVSAN